ncbi:MAG: type VI secretion system protein TssA [Spirochaetaceae bacterium]|jgi:type VI secretion system ImpA family protein|nr:type VI secretion system protein TssA [Spirochaetaceae bacterium]
MIELSELAKPVSSDKPSGENMEYDQSYLELENLAEGKHGGDGTDEAASPDWKQLSENCKSLWAKTRDLRVAAYLTIAEASIGGIKELSSGLKLIHFLVNDMWDDFFPLTDPADGNDPTERVNIFSMLSPAPGSMNDPIMFINRFRETRLIPALPYTIRDLLIASGEIEPLDGQTVDINLISGELRGLPIKEIEDQAEYAKEAIVAINAICDVANAKMKDGNILSLESIEKEVKKIFKFFENHIKTVSPSQNIANANSDDVKQPENGIKNAAAVSTTEYDNVNIGTFKAANRQDALLLLKKALDYYTINEPSSPVSLLVSRALRLADMNFLELLENMIPEAVSHGKDILAGGVQAAVQRNTQNPPVSAPPVAPSSPPSTPTPDSPAPAPQAVRAVRIPRVPK